MKTLYKSAILFALLLSFSFCVEAGESEIRTEQDPMITSLLQASQLTESWYLIVGKYSGKCVDESCSDIGCKIHQWECHGGLNQRWRIISQDDGSVSLKSLSTGRIMDIAGVSQDNGAITHAWDYIGANNQKMWIESSGGGYFRLKFLHSNKCLDIVPTNDNGARIGQWDCADVPQQRFSFMLIEVR
jgi:hypothetical protein